MKSLKYIGIGIAIVAFNQVFILTPIISQEIYYILMLIGVIAGLVYSKKITINPFMVWLLLAAVASLMLNQVPAYFKASQRLISFLIVIALIGPLLFSEGINYTKQVIFQKLNWIILVVASLSFLVYALHLPIKQNAGFSGFITHSMMLGPITGIALLIGIYQLFSLRNVPITSLKKQLIILLILFSFFSLLLASSRSAIVATISGFLFFLYKYYHAQFSRFFSTIFVLILLIFITFPAWSDYTKGIYKKQNVTVKSGDLIVARRAYWDARIIEFSKSPVYGNGFSTIKFTKKGYGVNKDTGGIEPGTSWLAILSMLGLVGFILVFLLFEKNLIFLIRDKTDPLRSALLGGLLILFITHMFAEGYIFASGSFLFFYVWLLIGIIEIFRKTGQIKIL